MEFRRVLFRAGVAEALPRRQPKAAKPTRRAVAFWLQAPGGEILLRRRPEQGLLGGMMEVPSTPWRAAPWDAAEARAAVPELVSLGDEWRALPGVVRHTFTHFHFEVTVWAAQAMDVPAAAGRWLAPDAFADAAVPTAMRKT